MLRVLSTLKNGCILILCLCVCVCPPEAQTRHVMKEFSDVYEQQYAVALFNSVRFEIEGAGGPQSQLLHRKVNTVVLEVFSQADMNEANVLGWFTSHQVLKS